MPLLDGYATCRTIRAWEAENDHAPLPMVSLSAHAMARGWRESAAAGFTHYAIKPVEWRDLGHIIIDILDSGRPHIFLKDRPKPEALLEEEREEEEEALAAAVAKAKRSKRAGKPK